MKILTIFAHPDDETMFSGGTLALLNLSGARIHFLCATRGEGGELGEPAICSREELHLYREHELFWAIQSLGGGSLSFLDYIDPLIGANQQLYPYTDDIDELVRKILATIEEIQPDVILSHGSSGEYGHPGHVLTHRGVRAAVERLGPQAPLLYTWCANFPGYPRPRHANLEDPAHLILDVTPVMAQKARAAYCHRSQHALFLRRRSKKAGYRLTIPEILLNIESLHRAFPPVQGKPRDAFISLLSPWETIHAEN